MTYKNTARVVYSLLAIIIVGFITVLYWEFQPAEVVKLNRPITVTPPILQAGGYATISVDLCKLQDIKGSTRVSYISVSREIFQPMGQEQLAKGCHIQQIPIIIPKDTPNDTYQLRFRTTYQINPIRTVVEEYTTDRFTITGFETK